MRRVYLTAFFLGWICLYSGCASMPTVEFDVLQPGGITVSPEIQKIVLVNRYMPEKGGQTAKRLEAIVTGEKLGQDRIGSAACLDGLVHRLARSPRFQFVKSDLELLGSGTGVFPVPLSPDEVRRISQDYGVDAVLAVEAFDSDVYFDREEKQSEHTLRNGEIQIVTVCLATARVNVTTGWRLYDGATGRLLDEYQDTGSVRHFGTGPTSREAEAGIPDRRELVAEMGKVAGELYATRLAPTYSLVRRNYYGSGSPHLKSASRRVEAGDWENAERLWRDALKRDKEDVQGKAAYNLALAHEAKQDLDGALKWAETAEKQYGDKNAMGYRRTLNHKVSEQRRLARQMGDENQDAKVLEITCDDFRKMPHRGHRINLEDGENFELRLCSNPSTGHTWAPIEVQEQGAILELVAVRSEGAGTDLEGASGKRIWTFKALRSGLQRLDYKCGRALDEWEEPSRTFHLTVVVK